MQDTLKVWQQIVESRNAEPLASILADDAVLISPVVHTPQRGKQITRMYLTAALNVLVNDHFKYIRKTQDEEGVIMEFETLLDGITINGVDMVKWDSAGLITEFKVMVRPLQAVNKVHQKMGEMLEQFKAAS